MRKPNHDLLTGNEKFEGYAVDLLEMIAEKLNVSYRIHIVGDGKYGNRDKITGEWNGMIRELIDQVKCDKITSFQFCAFFTMVTHFNIESGYSHC